MIKKIITSFFGLLLILALASLVVFGFWLALNQDESAYTAQENLSQRLNNSLKQELDQIENESSALDINDEKVLFSFSVTSDIDHIEGNTIFEHILSQVRSNDSSFFVIPGDISQGRNKNEFIAFNQAVNTLDIPTYVAIGDNDLIQKLGKKPFESTIGKRYFSFDEQNAHFVILDNADKLESFGSEQLDWLEQDLKKNTSKQTFLFFHRPVNIPFAELVLGPENPQAAIHTNRFVEIISALPPAAIFNGHLHSYYSYKLGNIPVYITGGGGSQYQFGDETFYHFLEIKVRESDFDVQVQKIDQ